MRQYTTTFSRIALFIIYFWFGLLKVLGSSPASPLVLELHAKTVSFISPDLFLALFGGFEVLIGLMFLISIFVPQIRTATVVLFTVHMFTAVLPLVLVPEMVWQSKFIPTLEGQYIIKNLALIAVVLNL
ncbi:MAG TPA: hypothetical protein VJG48_03710 [Candidatus Paceibacterota bacterium]